MSLFNTKFFGAEAKFSPVELGRTREYLVEDLDLYMRRFHERAIICYDPVAEEALFDVCLHGVIQEYHVFLENLSFPSFSKLMDVARRTNESIRRT